MDNISKETTLAELERTREQLLAIINTTIDSLVDCIESGNTKFCSAAKTAYPISFNSTFFKGKKPSILIIGDELIEVKKWREVYIEILKRCCAEKYDALMPLRNFVSGRKRAFLADKPDGMNVPIMLADELYVEAFFDTEFLLKTLIHILTAVQYDYSGISVVLRSVNT